VGLGNIGEAQYISKVPNRDLEEWYANYDAADGLRNTDMRVPDVGEEKFACTSFEGEP